MKTEANIPFPGFYESWLDQELDSIIELEIEYYETERDEKLDWDDFKVDFEAAAQAYVRAYHAWLVDQLYDADSELQLAEFEFFGMTSPKFYNFETDRVFIAYPGPVSDLWQLRKDLAGLDTLQEDIELRFKSRDGFMSFYDEFVDTWKEKPLEDWDINELVVLFPYPEPWELYEYINEDLYDCVERRETA